MILGSDFIEERLFAFRDYANLPVEEIKRLMKERSIIAKKLKHDYDNLKYVRAGAKKKIIENSGGDVDKIFDLIGRKEVFYKHTGRSGNNYANPSVFNEAADRMRRDAQSRAKKAAMMARDRSEFALV